MLGVFAEFETNLRRERQLEGIAKAKAAGVYRGRKPSVDAVEVQRLKAEGLGASQIAKRLKIGRASVYRVLEAWFGQRISLAMEGSQMLLARAEYNVQHTALSTRVEEIARSQVTIAFGVAVGMGPRSRRML
jgi:hypothetical protein